MAVTTNDREDGLARSSRTGVASLSVRFLTAGLEANTSHVFSGSKTPQTFDPLWYRRSRVEKRTDEQLMLAYQRGDTPAFEVLLKRHERGVFGFALRQLGSRAQAEEVTQESFLRVIRASSRYTVRSSFRNYLYEIARNLCLDLLRRKSRESEEIPDGEDPPGVADSVLNGDPGPESRAGTRQLRLLLSRALQQLPPEQREVVLLKEVRDLRLEDVARITGTNLNTVKSRLRYALLGLREHLSREGVGREDGHEL